MNEFLLEVSDSPEVSKAQFKDAFITRNNNFIHRYFARHGRGMLRDIWLVNNQCSRSIENITYALSIGFDVNNGDYLNGWNVMHWSAYEGSLEMFSYFWQTYPQLRGSLTPKGDFLSSVGNGYENVLHCAARGNRPQIIQFICAQNILNVNAVAAHGKTALQWAMTKNYRQCALWLILYGANPALRDSEGRTPFENCQIRWQPNQAASSYDAACLQFASRLMRLAAMQDPVAKDQAIREVLDEETSRLSASSICTLL